MQGAKLVVKNGAKLTCVGNCKAGMWDGIEVWGNNQNDQDLNNIYLDANNPSVKISSFQGYALLTNNVTIENAKIGITASNLSSVYNNYQTGGIINADNVHFRNNHIDAEVLWYHNLNINAPFNEIPNKSYFKLCKFENDAILFFSFNMAIFLSL